MTARKFINNYNRSTVREKIETIFSLFRINREFSISGVEEDGDLSQYIYHKMELRAPFYGNETVDIIVVNDSIKYYNYSKIYERSFYDNLNDLEIISPSLVKIIPEIGDLSFDQKIDLIKKYHLKRSEYIWVSQRGKLFAGSKEIKLGKLLNTLVPESKYLIDHYAGILAVKRLTVKNVSIAGVEETYKSPQLKIGSCMSKNHLDLSIYSKIDAQSIKIEDKSGNIIARSILWGGSYYDRIYSTNKELGVKFEKLLKQKGYTDVDKHQYKTPEVSGNVKDYFIPYMDSLMYIHKTKNGFFFSNEEDGAYYYARNTNGTVGGN